MHLIFPPDPANFSASPRPPKNFTMRSEVSGKIKKVNLIKLAEKGDKQKENATLAFLFFILLKIVPIDSELNYTSGNGTHFYKIYEPGTQKSSQI